MNVVSCSKLNILGNSNACGKANASKSVHIRFIILYTNKACLYKIMVRYILDLRNDLDAYVTECRYIVIPSES